MSGVHGSRNGTLTEREKISSSRASASIIPLLQRVQEDEGFVSEQAIEQVARQTGSPASAVYGVATFYSQFRFGRPGKHMIRVCEGTACHVLGIATVLERLTEELGVRVGGTTADGLFTLESVRCLGCCSLAPTLMIDDETYGRVTPDSVAKIVASYREDVS